MHFPSAFHYTGDQSSVMELAGILLAVWILVLSPPSTSAETGQLVLRHGYPENTNLSYISLTCLREDPKLHSVEFNGLVSNNSIGLAGKSG